VNSSLNLSHEVKHIFSGSHFLPYNALSKGHRTSALEVGQGPVDVHLVLNKIRLGE
jgi:hypothetical protein